MVARNTLLNAIGLTLPLALGLLLLPVVTGHLGPTRFGLLGLASALLEYLSMVDVGLGRATTRYLADALVSDRRAIPRVVSTSLALQAALGVVGGLALAACAPLLAERVLDMPPALQREARVALYLIAGMLPLVLVSLGLRGVLEAAQRFDLATWVRIPASSLTFVIPAAASAAGAGLPTILALLLVARVGVVAAYAVAARRAVPELRLAPGATWGDVRGLAAFGGWLTVSNIANPLFLYLDRFVLGARAGVAAVGFYTAPFELMYRLLVFPASLSTALLPAMASAAAARDGARMRHLYASGIRYVALVMLPICAVTAAGAPALLAAWVGPQFAERSAPALRLLAVGLFANAVAHVASATLHALGRPDVTAKGHAAELVVHAPATFALVDAFGIPGAAAAWALRATIDMTYLLVASYRIAGLSPRAATRGRGRPALLTAGALGVGMAIAVYAGPATVAGAAALVAAPALYSALVWRLVLDRAERRALFALLPGVTPAPAAGPDAA